MDTSLTIVLRAQNLASAALNEVRGQLQRIQEPLTNLGMGAIRLGASLSALSAPVAVFGGLAVRSFMSFEQAMRNVNSIAHMTEEQLRETSDQVLELARHVPQGPQVLARALYDIYSSGFAGAEAMDILEQSARAASAGMTDAFTAGKALMAVINAYPDGMYNASTASDLLFQTVNLGVLTFEELASQIGDVLPTAAALGVPLHEIGAAFATITRGGISAAEAATAINQALLSFLDPSRDALKLADHLGIEFGASTIQTRGFAGALEYVYEATGGNLEYLGRLFGNVRALKAVLSLLREEGKEFSEMLDGMKSAMEGAGATTLAYNEQSKGLWFQTQVLKSELSAVSLIVLSQLVPAFNQLLSFARPLIQQMAELVAHFVRTKPELATLAAGLGILAVAIGPILISFGLLATALSALLSPVGLVIAAIAALGVAFAANFGDIQSLIAGLEEIFGGVVDRIRSIAGQLREIIEGLLEGFRGASDTWAGTWNTLAEVAGTVLNAVSSVVETALSAINGFFAEHGQEIQSRISEAWSRVAEIVRLMAEIVQGIVVPIFNAIADFIREHGAEIEAILSATWDAISTAIDTTLAVIQGILTAVLALIRGDWEGAWEAMRGVVDTVLSGIEQGINTGMSLVQAAWDTGLAVLQDIGSRIWQALPEDARVALTTLAETVKGKVDEVVAGIEGLLTRASETWDNIRGGLEETAEGIRTAIEGAAITVHERYTEIVNVVQEKSDAARETALAAWERVRDEIQPILDAIRDTINGYLSVISGFIEEHGDEIKAFFSEAWEGIKEIIGLAVEIIKAIILPPFEEIAAFLREHGDEIKAALGEAWNTIRTVIGQAVEHIAGFVSATWEGIRITIETVMEAIGTILRIAWGRITSHIAEVFNRISSFTLGHREDLIAILGGAWRFISNLILASLETIKGILRTALALIRGDWERAWEEIKQTLHNILPKLESALQGAMDALKSIARIALDAIKDTVGEKVGEWIAAIRNKIGEMSAAGQALIDGLKDGIRNAAQGVIDAVSGVVNDAIARAKNLLGIRSPSRVFGEIGQGVSAGLAAGILETARDVLEAVRTMLGGMEEEAARGAANVVGSVRDIMGALADLAQSAAALAEAELPAGIVGMVQGLAVYVMEIVAELEEVAEALSEDGVEAAQRFADAAEASVGWIADAVKAFMALKEYDQSFSVSAAGLWKLKQQIANMVHWLLRISQDMDVEAAPAAEAWARTAERAVGLIADAVDAFMALKNYDANFDLVQAGLGRLKAQIVNMVQWLLRVSRDLEQEGVEAATGFANAALGILGVVEQAVGAFGNLKDLPSVEEAMPKLTAVMELIGRTVFGMMQIAEFFDEDRLEATAAAMGDVEDVIAILKDGAEAVKALSRVSDVSRSDITNTLETLMDLIRSAIESLADLPGSTVEAVESALRSAFEFGAGWVDAIMEGIRSRLGDLEELLAYIRGLFPSSPARHGPFRRLPDGEGVTGDFVTGLRQGLQSGLAGLARDMEAIAGLLGLAPTAPALQPVGMAPVGGLTEPLVVNLQINNPSVRSDQDLEDLARLVSEMLARDASIHRRLRI